MSMYDAQVGACGPGCGPYGYAPYGYGGYPGVAYGPLAYPTGYDIVGRNQGYDQMGRYPGYDLVGANGAAPTPTPTPATPGLWDKVKTWGQTTSLDGIKNQNLLLGAAGLGLIYYGYTAGWFGKRPRHARR